MKEHNSYDQLVETCEMHTSASCKVKRRNFFFKKQIQQDFVGEFYVQNVANHSYLSVLARLLGGTLPLMLELGRYRRPKCIAMREYVQYAAVNLMLTW